MSTPFPYIHPRSMGNSYKYGELISRPNRLLIASEVGTPPPYGNTCDVRFKLYLPAPNISVTSAPAHPLRKSHYGSVVGPREGGVRLPARQKFSPSREGRDAGEPYFLSIFSGILPRSGPAIFSHPAVRLAPHPVQDNRTVQDKSPKLSCTAHFFYTISKLSCTNCLFLTTQALRPGFNPLSRLIPLNPAYSRHVQTITPVFQTF